MGLITVPYSVLTDGYTISGDPENGYKAVVPYVVTWENAFTFVNQLVARTPITNGAFTFYVPYRFPTTSGVNLYALSFEMEPCGATGSPIPNGGLLPGEFFSHAKVSVTFGQMSFFQGQGSDSEEEGADEKNQLDPSNPIVCCKQSVKSKSKVVTRKGRGYEFESDNKELLGDFGVRIVESALTLNFPRVPQLPWLLIEPYLGCVNDAALLGCARGTLLLEDFDTESVSQSDGSSAQSVTLAFKHQSYDWNMQPRPDTGVLDIVKVKGSSDYVYQYENFQEVIDALKFTVVNEQ